MSVQSQTEEVFVEAKKKTRKPKKGWAMCFVCGKDIYVHVDAILGDFATCNCGSNTGHIPGI